MTSRGWVVLAGVVLLAAAPALAQRNGGAASSVPAVDREAYDARVFMAPIRLSETELAGRRLVAQRCANCHAGNMRQPGPPLGKSIIESRGEAFVREKILKGSTLMPGYQYSLQPAQIADIIAFLRTYSAPAPGPGGAQE